MRREPAGGWYLTGRMLLLATAACLLVGGCSRLTFIKPDYTRGEFGRTAPEVDIDTDPVGQGAARARLLVVHGQNQLQAGKLDEAAETAGQALDLDPRSAAAHTLMALVADRRDDADTAGEHYRRAVELGPMRGGMLNNYGTWLCQNGEPDESIEWFRRALSAPGYATPAVAAANGGACARMAGEHELAGQFLEAALEMDPENPVALQAMAEREFEAGRAFHARAFSQRRLAAAPATADALRLASQIEDKLGDREAAARYVQRLRAEFPDSSGSGNGEDGTR